MTEDDRVCFSLMSIDTADLRMILSVKALPSPGLKVGGRYPTAPPPRPDSWATEEECSGGAVLMEGSVEEWRGSEELS